jgi:hypothetical protein
LPWYELVERCEPVFRRPDIVSVRCVGASRMNPGGHEWPYDVGHTVIVDGSAAREIKLAELFVADATKWRSRLRTLVVREVNKEKLARKAGSASDQQFDDAFGEFTLDDRGLTFYFAPYQLGPGGEGGYDALVTWDELAPMLDSHGPSSRARGSRNVQ